MRYLWTVTIFGEHQVAEGRTAELMAARSQAEATLASWLVRLGDASGNA